MLSKRVLSVFAVLATVVSWTSAQEHHTAMDKRGAQVMGFDQALTTHQFILFTDGGAIDVSVKDASDTKNLAAIRSHLPRIAKMFGEGHFDAPMLVHDSKDVPGTRTMADRKMTIQYQYVETPSGGRVNIVTADPESLSAVHDFLRFQIADHQTGDSTAVQKR